MLTDAFAFFAEFTRHPRSVGAIAPTGTALAQRMIAPVPHTGPPVVVELGPGTGAVTAGIQRRLAGRGRHIAIEVNARFAARLARAYPDLDVVTGDAADLREILAAADAAADVVISGLPWALFSSERQRRTLDAIAAVLTTPGGVFTTFAYVHALWTPPARRFRAQLADRFEEIVLERTVWGNLPPATVYHCRRPILCPTHLPNSAPPHPARMAEWAAAPPPRSTTCGAPVG